MIGFPVPHLAEEFVLAHKSAPYWGGSPRKHWLRWAAGHKAASRGTEDADTDSGHADMAGRGEFGTDREGGMDVCTPPRVRQLVGTCVQHRELMWPLR